MVMTVGCQYAKKKTKNTKIIVVRFASTQQLQGHIILLNTLALTAYTTHLELRGAQNAAILPFLYHDWASEITQFHHTDLNVDHRAAAYSTLLFVVQLYCRNIQYHHFYTVKPFNI